MFLVKLIQFNKGEIWIIQRIEKAYFLYMNRSFFNNTQEDMSPSLSNLTPDIDNKNSNDYDLIGSNRMYPEGLIYA